MIMLHLQGYPAVRPELDLVEQEDQLTHEVSLDEEIDPETSLGTFSIFKFVFFIYNNHINMWSYFVVICLSFYFVFLRHIQTRPQLSGERKAL